MRTGCASITGAFVLTWTAIFLSGCQRQEATVTEAVQPEAQAEATRVAWVDAERISNADAEPENWLVHGRTWSLPPAL